MELVEWINDHSQPKTPERTNWYVITGAPCSGKTSVLRGLEQRGFQVVDEVARAFIDSQLARGRTLAEIKADVGSFERHILFEKMRIEKNLSRNRTVFFDRAVPDSIAYFQVEGLELLFIQSIQQLSLLSGGKMAPAA